MTRTEDELRATLKEPADEASHRRLTTMINELAARNVTGGSRRVLPGVAVAASILIVIAVTAAVVGARSIERGTGRGAASDPSATVDSSGYRYLGPIPSSRTEAGTSLLLEPPPSGARSGLSPAQAYDAWCGDYRQACRAHTVTPDIELAVLTTAHSGRVRSTGGPIVRPGTDHVLSYVVTRHGVRCPMRGGVRPGGTTSAGSTPPALRCTELEAVNANTGKSVAGQYIFS